MEYLCFSSDIDVVRVKDIDICSFIIQTQKAHTSGPCWSIQHANTDWAYLDLLADVTHQYSNNIASTKRITSTNALHWWYGNGRMTLKPLCKWAYYCPIPLAEAPQTYTVISWHGWLNVYGRIRSRHQPPRAPEQRFAYWDRLNDIHAFWDGIWGESIAISTIFFYSMTQGFIVAPLSNQQSTDPLGTARADKVYLQDRPRK